MSSAQWITPSDLGSYQDNYDFNLKPISIGFESDIGRTVSPLNGSLPSGLRYSVSSGILSIVGESTGVTVTTTSEITFRIVDPDGTIADRTYYITIVPYVVFPTWASQEPFLGFMTVNTTARFTVRALTTANTRKYIEYRLVRAPGYRLPSGMSIDSKYGIITYSHTASLPLPVAYEQTYTFIVRAILGSVFEDIICTITVIGIDHVPGWITPSGSLGNYIVGNTVEVGLSAYEPSGNAVTFSLINSVPTFPFTLSSSGLIYGKAPFTVNNATYNFMIGVTSNVGTSTRKFSIVSYQTATSGSLQWLSNVTDLGTFVDGRFVSINVGAASSRTYTVVHSVVGGTLPPDLVLNSTQGYLAGFIEFHPQPRDYRFEISATDGFQILTRQYHISIAKGAKGMYFDVIIPIEGDIKKSTLDTRAELIPQPYLFPFVSTQPQSIPSGMALISGLNYQLDDPFLAMSVANAQLHSTTLLIGNIGNANVGASSYTIFYKNIIDPQANASFTSSRISNSTSVNFNPVSLENMRTAIASGCGFENCGYGSGAALLPIVDAETTSISKVEIVNSGSNFYFSPRITISGSGNSATFSSTITVQEVTVTDPGYGWIQNTQFNVRINDSNVVVLNASLVNDNSELEEVSIIDGGEFTIFPQGNKFITDGNAAIAEVSFNLGISNVTVHNGGLGYSTIPGQTTLSTLGTESLPVWQEQWMPYIEIGTVFSQYAQQIQYRITPSIEAIMGSYDLYIQHISVKAKGRAWTGNTMFDQDLLSFDGGQTRLIEWIEPIDTIFDYDKTTFDFDGTVFSYNTNYGLGLAEWAMWTKTYIEYSTSIFDLYGLLIETIDPTVDSISTISNIYRLKSQQIGCFNKQF